MTQQRTGSDGEEKLEVDGELRHLRADVDLLRADIKDLRMEMHTLGSELRAEIRALGSELRADMR